MHKWRRWRSSGIASCYVGAGGRFQPPGLRDDFNLGQGNDGERNRLNLCYPDVASKPKNVHLPKTAPHA
jgi:hypothetical protein